MAPTGAAYHVDWVFSNASNVHVATHRDRFTAFTEFKTELTNGFEVLGIGDVELEVKTHENRKGRKSHRTLILRDVLLVPKCVCNILGAAIQNEYAVQYGSGCGLKDKRTGRSMGLLDRAHFMKLWLVGHSRGTSSLDPDTLYWINAMWSDSERVRWELHKVNISKPMRQSAEPDSPPYVSAEKAWLKRAFGGEFKFLRSYGLSIYRDKDREEGRRIARGLIEIEAFEDNGVADRKYGEDSADMELKAFLANVQANPTSQFAKSMADRVEKFHTVERKVCLHISNPSSVSLMLSGRSAVMVLQVARREANLHPGGW